ncbi:type I pullulanase [Mycoplasmopsis agassizii]|uniref:type I pullulanase n=1 Tax=Mycoplasmopsis agassizii TaxID=33922 RepID=UPI003528A294
MPTSLIPQFFQNNYRENLQAYYDRWDLVTLSAPKNFYHKGDAFNIFIEQEHTTYQAYILNIESYEGRDYVKLKVPRRLYNVRSRHYIIDKENNHIPIKAGSIVFQPDFDRFIYYSGNDLGYHYSKEETKFVLYAPLAISVSLVIYNPDTKEELQRVLMEDRNNGTYSVTLDGDCELIHYRYAVFSNDEETLTVDPYAFASNANSEFSCVIDKSKTDSAMEFPKVKKPIKNYTDAIIYELNVRDFTDSGFFGNRGKFLGLTEENLKDQQGNKIGLDYLIELGITHVQLLPIYDFQTINEMTYPKANEYNWGYDPVQFNVPEGSYALYPNNPYSRIFELKKMISKLHEKNISVVMDVVFNHVYQTSNFSWQKIIPGYYFRFDQHGFFSNASGVGNDVASERLMVRKYIVDMCRYWITEFKLDGFRFDLMGLIDVETMNAITKMAHKINPNFIIYGEGWNMPTASLLPMAHMQHHQMLPKIGFFNDYFRNTIRGSHWDKNDTGYASGNFLVFNKASNAIMASLGINGFHSIFDEPWQSVNYIEVHDNQTFYDFIQEQLPTYNDDTLQKIALMGLAIVILSQGIPVIHAGQELFRTKFGEDNTYNKSISYNRFDWNKISEHYWDLNFIKRLISIRKTYSLFRLNTKAEIQKYIKVERSKSGLTVYILENEVDNFLVLINNTSYNQDYFFTNGKMHVLTNNYHQYPEMDDEKITIRPFGFYVLHKPVKR